MSTQEEEFVKQLPHEVKFHWGGGRGFPEQLLQEAKFYWG